MLRPPAESTRVKTGEMTERRTHATAVAIVILETQNHPYLLADGA